MTNRAHYVNNAFTVDGRAVHVVPNAVCTLYEAGTSTPLAATIYAGNSGGTTLTNPFTTDAYGTIDFYLIDPQSVKIVTSGVGVGTLTADYQHAHADPGDYLRTSIETPLTDLWALANVPAAGVGYDQLALSRGSTTGARTRGYPQVFLQNRTIRNQDKEAQIPADLYLHSESFGSVLKAAATNAGTSTASTFKDTGATFNSGHVGGYLTVLDGASIGEHAEVLSVIDANTVSISPNWTVTPAAGSQYMINDGNAPQVAGMLINVLASGTNQPNNREGQEHLGLMIYARRRTVLSRTILYGTLAFVENIGSLGASIGSEWDMQNATGGDAPTAESLLVPRRSLALNVSGWHAGVGSRWNTVALYCQSDGPDGAFLDGIVFDRDSVKDYAINYSLLVARSPAGTHTPYVELWGQTQAAAGRRSVGGVTPFLRWLGGASDVLQLGGGRFDFQNALGSTSIAQFYDGNLLMYASGGTGTFAAYSHASPGSAAVAATLRATTTAMQLRADSPAGTYQDLEFYANNIQAGRFDASDGGFYTTGGVYPGGSVQAGATRVMRFRSLVDFFTAVNGTEYNLGALPQGMLIVMNHSDTKSVVIPNAFNLTNAIGDTANFAQTDAGAVVRIYASGGNLMLRNSVGSNKVVSVGLYGT